MIVCVIAAMTIGYGVRRYQANQHLDQMWRESETFFDENFLETVAQSDELKGKVSLSEMDYSRSGSHFYSNGWPLFTSASFGITYGAAFHWDGNRDEYAIVNMSVTLPRFGTKPAITIRGHHQELDHVVIEELIHFAEAKFGLVPIVVYNDPLVTEESMEWF